MSDEGPGKSRRSLDRVSRLVAKQRVLVALQPATSVGAHWYLLGGIGLLAIYRQPLLGVCVLAVAGLVGITLGGGTRLAVPVLYIVTLYVFSARFAVQGPRLTVAFLMAAASAGLFVAGRLAHDNAHIALPSMRSPFVFSLLAYGTVCVTSYFLGMLMTLQPAEVSRADRALQLLIVVAGMAFLVYDAARSYADVRRLLAGLLVGATVMAIATCIQAATGQDVVRLLRLPGFVENGGIGTRTLERLGLERAFGTATHPIEAGTTMAAAVPVALHFLNHARRLWSRLLYTAAALLLVAGSVATVSRSAIVGLALGAVLLVPRWSSARRFATVVGGLVAGAVLAIAFPRFADVTVRIMSDLRGDQIAGANIQARTADYDVVREIVANRPLLGRGYGTFDPGVHFATDNQVLKTLLEVGVIGLLFLVVFIIATAREAGVARRLAVTDRERDIALTAQTSFLLIAVSMLFYDGMSFGVCLGSFLFLAGCCGALGRIGREEALPSQEAINALEAQLA